MRKLLLLLPAVALIACDNSTDGHSFDPPEGYEARSGQAIYQKHCVSCHGPNGDAGVGGAKDLSASKMDSTEIVNLLKKGQNGMPKQIHHFESKEEVGNVIDYLKSMRK